MEIHSSARRHGIRDDDIRHAYEQALAWVELGDDPVRHLLAGPDSAGNLLEPVVLLAPWAAGAGDPRYEAASQHSGRTLRRCHMTTHTAYGHTGDGTPIDDAFVNRLADEAERGYSPKQLEGKPRGRGRPPLGDRAKAVGSVRLDPELREQAAARAAGDGVSVSEIVRRALREYLHSA